MNTIDEKLSLNSLNPNQNISMLHPFIKSDKNKITLECKYIYYSKQNNN